MKRALTLASLALLVAGCAAPAPEPSASPASTTVAAPSPTSPAPVTTTTAPPTTTVATTTLVAPPPAAGSRVEFRRKIEEPQLPPAPLAEFRGDVGARVQISGGWEGEIRPDTVSCTTYDDPRRSRRSNGWEYSATEADVIQPLSINLSAKWETPSDGWRTPYAPSVKLGWDDAEGRSWEAYTSWGGSLDDPGPTVAVSADRRSIRFTGRAVAQPGWVGETDQIEWITFDGTLTCVDPMHDIN